MKRKYAFNKLIIPKIWPIQVETNFSQDEIKSFEEVGFVLNKLLIFLRSLFGGESSIPINKLVDEMLWPITCNAKVVC